MKIRSSNDLALEMHLPRILADLKYRRQIAEKVFSVNLRLPRATSAVRLISEFLREKMYALVTPFFPVCSLKESSR